MARILVAGPDGLGARLLLNALVERLRADGHDAAALPTDGTAEAVVEADALVAVLDGAMPPAAAVWVGHAAALGKPLLGLHGGDAPPALLEACSRTATGADAEELFGNLGAFYEDVRPFAGRLVRDHVPRLVEEAGHEVRFRELAADERPRFLKQKVHEEAKALLKADRGTEPDEIADLLEALETLIRTRGFEREELRRVKEGKLRRRGGFEKCYVVEATARDGPEATGTRAEGAQSDALDGDAPVDGDAQVDGGAGAAGPAAAPEAPAKQTAGPIGSSPGGQAPDAEAPDAQAKDERATDAQGPEDVQPTVADRAQEPGATNGSAQREPAKERPAQRPSERPPAFEI